MDIGRQAGNKGMGVSLYMKKQFEWMGCLWIRIGGGADMGDIMVSECYRSFGLYEEEDKVIFKQLRDPCS